MLSAWYVVLLDMLDPPSQLSTRLWHAWACMLCGVQILLLDTHIETKAAEVTRHLAWHRGIAAQGLTTAG